MESLGAFRRQYSDAWSAGMRAKLGLPDGLDDAVASPLVDELLTSSRRATSTTRRSSARLGAAARGDAEPARGHVPRTSRHSTPGLARWRALGPDADADGPGQPRLHPAQPPGRGGPRRRDRRRPGSARRLLDAVTAPFDERPGLERYAAAAPDDFGAYRTFCGT